MVDRIGEIPQNLRRSPYEGSSDKKSSSSRLKVLALVSVFGAAATAWYFGFVAPYDTNIKDHMDRNFGGENQPAVAQPVSAAEQVEEKQQTMFSQTFKVESGDAIGVLVGEATAHLGEKDDYTVEVARDGGLYLEFTDSQAYLKAVDVPGLVPAIWPEDLLTVGWPPGEVQKVDAISGIVKTGKTITFKHQNVTLGGGIKRDEITVTGGAFGDPALGEKGVFVLDDNADGQWQAVLPNGELAPAVEITSYMDSDPATPGFEHTFDQAADHFQSQQTANN